MNAKTYQLCVHLAGQSTVHADEEIRAGACSVSWQKTSPKVTTKPCSVVQEYSVVKVNQTSPFFSLCIMFLMPGGALQNLTK